MDSDEKAISKAFHKRQEKKYQDYYDTHGDSYERVRCWDSKGNLTHMGADRLTGEPIPVGKKKGMGHPKIHV